MAGWVVMMVAALKKPWPWAILASASLVIALVLDPSAPAWMFWGSVALSCVGSFIATWLSR